MKKNLEITDFLWKSDPSSHQTGYECLLHQDQRDRRSSDVVCTWEVYKGRSYGINGRPCTSTLLGIVSSMNSANMIDDLYV